LGDIELQRLTGDEFAAIGSSITATFERSNGAVGRLVVVTPTGTISATRR